MRTTPRLRVSGRVVTPPPTAARCPAALDGRTEGRPAFSAKGSSATCLPVEGWIPANSVDHCPTARVAIRRFHLPASVSRNFCPGVRGASLTPQAPGPALGVEPATPSWVGDARAVHTAGWRTPTPPPTSIVYACRSPREGRATRPSDERQACHGVATLRVGSGLRRGRDRREGPYRRLSRSPTSIAYACPSPRQGRSPRPPAEVQP